MARLCFFSCYPIGAQISYEEEPFIRINLSEFLTKECCGDTKQDIANEDEFSKILSL